MDGFLETLKGKLGPLPVWLWATLGTAALAVFLIHKKSTSATNANTTGTAADQSNTDLGSASELANLFNVAGLMPYQGGDVYVNGTSSTPPPTTYPNGTTSPDVIQQGTGKDLGPYLTGQQEISYIAANIGKYGYTPTLLKNVQAAYAAQVKSKGVNLANSYHYASHNGKVTAESSPPTPVT